MKPWEKKCTCDTEDHEEHTCPYAEEIGNDHESLCKCCDYYEYQCATDI